MSQSNNLAQSKSGLVLQQFPYDTFGEAEPYVCEARMYRSLVLTDFHMLRESKFGFARKMLYLCRALGNALQVWAAAQHSSYLCTRDVELFQMSDVKFRHCVQ